ncbi:MAG: hypothetical protein ACR2IK_00340 [Chloroflexota bacterium]
MSDSFSQSKADQGVMELIVDQLEELVVSIIEEIRERPMVALAIVAGVVGAIIGSVLAGGLGRRTSPPVHVVRKARGVSEAADLAGLGLRLLQNPMVRGYVRSIAEGQLKKRFSR